MASKLIVMVAAMAFSACASSQQPNLPPPPQEPEVVDPDARSVDSGLILDAAQLDKLFREAEIGDGFAAFRLSLHFMSQKRNEQAKYWLLYAAARGQSAAQYSLWFNLKDRKDCKSKLEALAWLRSAAVNDDKLAQEELEEFVKIAQPCFPE